MSQIFVFPGQGSQIVGMGKELFDNYPIARKVFEEIDNALDQKLSNIIFNGPVDELTLTTNVQPSIFAVSAAMLAVYAHKNPEYHRPKYVAGHSLGEYTALYYAGALSLSDTARLLRLRGDAMQRAVPAGQGAMAVVLGLEIVQMAEICRQTELELGGVCDIANDNAPGQVVISGSEPTVMRAMERARDTGAKRSMLLPLSVPPHSRLMAPVADEMHAALSKINMLTPTVPLISNKTCTPMTDVNEIKDALVYQITHGVRWRETILGLPTLGITETVEIGPGNVLTGLTPRIVPELAARRLEI